MSTKRRSRFLPGLFKSDKQPSPDTSDPGSLKKAYLKLLPTSKTQPKPRYECQYCCDLKKRPELVSRGSLPYDCQFHLGTPSNEVCKKCLEASLSAQMDAKALLEVGCPECGAVWDPEEVRYLICGRDEKKFRRLEELARERVVVPGEGEMPDAASTGVLLEKGARFCPWCKWPFIKEGGCDAMQCIKCGKCFNIEYALILEDNDGNRAAPIIDELGDDE